MREKWEREDYRTATIDAAIRSCNGTFHRSRMEHADESIINSHNGLLSLKTNPPKLLPHSPEYFSTIQIPCDWKDTPSPTPVFDGYLHTLVNGDPSVEQLLMEFIGVCVSNIKGWRMKKSLFLVGAGDTGKSQLKSLVERMLGSENFIGIDLKEIEARFGTGAIYGTRLAGSSDMSFMSVDELKTFKKITGGDSLFAEFKQNRLLPDNRKSRGLHGSCWRVGRHRGG